MRFLLLLLPLFCQAALEDHFRKIDPCPQRSPLRNIDSIYLINLDQRPEKLADSLAQLSPYGISPCRFSAIYGWDLSAKALDEVAFLFLPGMQGDEWVHHYPDRKQEYDFLTEKSYGKRFFCKLSTPGGIGCSLSHLSILQHAWDLGLETIWVLEDDVRVEGDPFLLPELIEKLDALVGKEGWDVLYTDAPIPLHEQTMWFLFRPDKPTLDRTAYAERTVISPDFLKVGWRIRTPSMIIRRSGMKKILDYEKKTGIFLPYDLELALVPDIRLYSLRYHLVTSHIDISDTQVQHFKNIK